VGDERYQAILELIKYQNIEFEKLAEYCGLSPEGTKVLDHYVGTGGKFPISIPEISCITRLPRDRIKKILDGVIQTLRKKMG